MRIKVWCRKHDCHVLGEPEWLNMADGTFAFDTVNLECPGTDYIPGVTQRKLRECDGSMITHDGSDGLGQKIEGCWVVQIVEAVLVEGSLRIPSEPKDKPLMEFVLEV